VALGVYKDERDIFEPCWKEPGTSEKLRLAELTPTPAAADWRRLCQMSAENTASSPPASGQGLHKRDWHEVQPALAPILDGARDPCVALTGRGGIGKTTTLKALFAHAAADPGSAPTFLTGEDLQGFGWPRVEAAFEHGRAEAVAAGKHLSLFIDAFEGLADRTEELRARLAALRQLTLGGGARVVLTVRAAVWPQIAPSGGAGTFKQVELTDWPEDIVRAEVKASERSRIGDDLIQLLRTPLLLDLFLRTFDTSQEVPAGLQSRHGILSAYWDRRVLVGDRVARATVLDRFAEEEARGTVLHRDPGPEARGLLSEGILVMHRQAAYAFRHALLRDFALMRWAFQADDPGSMVSRLQSIRSSLTRFGALRAVLEATCDRAPDTAPVLASGETVDTTTLIQALAPDSTALLMAAEVLGELDDPSPIDLDRLLARLPSAEQASLFVERLVYVAQLSLNRRWLDRFALLPESTQWAESTLWVSADLVCKLAALLEVIGRAQAAGARPSALKGSLRAVARRVRSWSQAPCLQPALLRGDAFDLAQRVMKQVTEVEPTAETFRWLEAYALRSDRTRRVVVELLRKFAACAPPVVDKADIEALYLRTGGLRWDDDVLVPESSNGPMWKHDWIEWALLDADRKGPGLLDSLPDRFLPVTFELLTGLEIEEEERRRSEWKKWSDEQLAALLGVSLPPPQRDVEARARDADRPQLSDEEATGNLVSDTSALVTPTRNPGTCGKIILRLRGLLEASLKQDGAWIAVYWSAARASRSAAARALLLDVLVGAGADVRRLDLVDEILADHRLYHFAEIHYALTAAIAARWIHLDPAARARILGNIEEVVRSPRLNGPYAVGPLLTAIPDEDHPPELRRYLDLYPDQGPPPPRRPSQRRSRATVSAIEPDDLFAQVARPEILPPGCVEHWKRVFRWRFPEGAGRNEALAAAVQDLRPVLDGCLPEGDALSRNVWTLQSVCLLLQALEQARGGEQAPLAPYQDAGQPDLRAIIGWGFRILEAFDAHQVNADRRPVERADTDAENGRVWSNALELLDAALAHPSVIDDPGLNERLLDWIAKVIEEPAPRLALQLVRAVRPYHWLRDIQRGAGLLRSLLGERLADAWALHASTGLVFRLPRPLRDEILGSWLTRPCPVPISGTMELPEKVGIFLGELSLRGDLSAAAMIDRLLLAQPTDGLLSEAACYRHFIKGIVFGAKKTVLEGGIGPDRAAEYARLLVACWDALQRTGISEEQARELDIALFAFHVLDSVRPHQGAEGDRDVRPWWIAMAPLAQRMVREGSRADVFQLVSLLREKSMVDKLGAVLLRDLVEALDARVKREDGETLRAWSGHGNDWPDILEYATLVLENVALAGDATEQMCDRIFEILRRWGEPPLGVERAVIAARNLRR
jgi:hypothetical protein